MSQISLQPPEKVDFSNSQTVSRDWKRFVQQWRNYELATGLQTKTMEVRLATLLCVLGRQGEDKFETLRFEEPNDKKDVEKVFEKITKDCEVRTNIVVERYKFLRRKQLEGENIDQFITALR